MRTGETLQGGKKANKWRLAHARSVQLLHKVLLHSASSLLLIWCRGNPRRALSFFFVFPPLPSLRPGAISRGNAEGRRSYSKQAPWSNLRNWAREAVGLKQTRIWPTTYTVGTKLNHTERKPKLAQPLRNQTVSCMCIRVYRAHSPPPFAAAAADDVAEEGILEAICSSTCGRQASSLDRERPARGTQTDLIRMSEAAFKKRGRRTNGRILFSSGGPWPILVRGRMGEKGTFPSARYSEGSADEG